MLQLNLDMTQSQGSCFAAVAVELTKEFEDKMKKVYLKKDGDVLKKLEEQEPDNRGYRSSQTSAYVLKDGLLFFNDTVRKSLSDGEKS
ncbi:hypothetical protein TWF730_001602 [Orbilia blumenaviensis]|uniref:Uncharacterized protein n=1 Tax=Orbilia blumenaviensis TaxID=1796055 RepID=A0AAV9UL99_9PEZI